MVDERDKFKAMRGTSDSAAKPAAPAAKATPATLSQAKALGFDSAKGITIQDGKFVFDKSLAPERSGFQSVGVAKPGEVQMTPYYGDVTGAYRLTQEQFAAAGATGGVMNTPALAKAMQENEIKELVAGGMSLEEATSKVSAQYGEYGVPLVSGGGYDASGKPLAGGNYNSDGTLATSGSTGASGASNVSKESRDAFAILDSAFKQYGLEALAGKIKDFMLKGLTSNEAIIELRKTSEYQTRFAGNAARLKSGLNSLSEGEYLALEDSYSETLRAYGQQAFFGVDRNARQAKIAEIIGADISAVEFKDRIATVVNRVESADPVIKATLRDFYKISDTDLVGYFLNPKENLPKLQEKVTAAEIGSAALNQGLDTSVASAEALAKAGVDLATARRGYSAIADVLPTATKLSQIYDESGMKYTQATAEAETFEGLASAQRKRMALAELELAQFSGRSGVGKTSLAQKPAGLI
jgi:uncharacterized protein YoaH (UPF0181 family)